MTLLIYGSPELSADLFHAIPVGVIDPFLYVEDGDRRAATVSLLDAEKVRPLGVEILDPYALGRDELLRRGCTEHEIEVEIALRACRSMGIGAAAVPPMFPVGVADHLRAGGVEVRVDADAFVERRRVKTHAQLEGIRRAQRAADAAMGVAAELIRELRPRLRAEEVRFAMQAACEEHGCELSDDVSVAHGPQGAEGHEPGHGEIPAGAPVVVDIWPRDRASRCWADMTRTFVAGGGEPDDELGRYWKLTRASLERVYPMIRAGGDCRAIFAASCEPFQEAGLPTQLTKEPGTILNEGYFHALGHGVGLEVHEAPTLGRLRDALVAGDVITLEPGCYRRGYGGCRLEDLVVVTEDGCERLTDFPYEV